MLSSRSDSHRPRTRRLTVAWLAAAAAPLVCAIGLHAQRPPTTSQAAPGRATTSATGTSRARAAAATVATGAAPFKPVASLNQLMASLIDPNADIVWGAVATIIDEKGTEERQPRTKEEWAAVEASALTLAESGNLLMLDGRAKDRDAWLRMARALVDAGEAAARAAAAHDVQALSDAGETVTIACDTCHGLYWKEGGSYSAAAHAPADAWAARPAR